jgi:hypothetical protein
MSRRTRAIHRAADRPRSWSTAMISDFVRSSSGLPALQALHRRVRRELQSRTPDAPRAWGWGATRQRGGNFPSWRGSNPWRHSAAPAGPEARVIARLRKQSRGNRRPVGRAGSRASRSRRWAPRRRGATAPRRAQWRRKAAEGWCGSWYETRRDMGRTSDAAPGHRPISGRRRPIGRCRRACGGTRVHGVAKSHTSRPNHLGLSGRI